MAGFNLTAQLQLQAPTNTSQVVGNIKKQLSGITADVQVKGDAGSLAKINKQMQSVNKSADASSRSVSNLNRNLSEAARRFSVITVATGTMLALARAIKNSVGEAIAFERELVKISQVTGKTVNQLTGLTEEITRLSTSLGASSKDLLNVSRVLAQAGFAANKTKQALDILAKTSLGATFDSIQDTTEGAIAVLRQFGEQARRVGGDIKFLEQTMDAINSVSKKFAVESGDLITVIRRVGGVFAAAGGEVNELISLFTSVRATTRESAETIATGLRTIFTRIQRTDTVDQLAALGIQLRDSQGQFVGAFEAVNRLSQGLSSLDPRDFRFSEIVESLGGFRQVGKVIPLIRQFTIAQDALNVAQASSGSVARDAATAQQSLQVQAAKVAEDFRSLIRTLSDSSTFRSVAKGALEMASAFIRIAEALEPLLPLITSLVALKIGSALAPGLGALTGIKPRAKSGGGRIYGFAKGGFVPGTGNRDTVPAMLSPGEFVIKKSSAKKMGAGALEAMNQNRYAKGGLVINELDSSQFAGLFAKPKGQDSSGKLIGIPPRQGKEGSDVLATLGKPASYFIGGTDEKTFTNKAKSVLSKGISDITNSLLEGGVESGQGKTVPVSGMKNILNDIGADDIAGKIFEGVTKVIIGDFSPGGGSQQGFDIPRSKSKALKGPLEKLFNAGIPIPEPDLDNKLTESDSNRRSLLKKALNSGIASTSTELQRFTGQGKNLSIKQLLQQQATKTNKDMARVRFQELGSAVQKVGSKGFDEETSQLVIKRLNADKQKLNNYIDNSKNPTIRTRTQKKATGGKIDSVPALLTPGEYVVNKSAAQSIGYSNLNKMNQTGVQKFAAGGAVGFKRFAAGGPTGKGLGLNVGAGLDFGGVIADFNNVEAAFQKIGVTGDKLTSVMGGVMKSFADGVGPAKAFDVALEEIRNSSEAAAAAAAAVPTGGDIAAQDVKDFGGPALTSLEGVSAAVGGDKGAQEALAAVQKQEILSITKAIRASDSSVTITEAKTRAEGVVSQKYGILASDIEGSSAASEKLNKERKSLTDKLKKRAKSIGAGIKGAAKDPIGTAGRIGAKGIDAAKSAQGFAQSAQSAVFFGSAIAATAVQMSGLSETTKQATTETVAFAAALVAGGSTAIDMLASLASVGKLAAAAETAETSANIASTTSEGAETVADTGEAVASAAAAAPLLILVGVVLAVVLALKFFANKAKAEADALAKGRKEALERLGQGEGGAGDAQSAKASIDAEFEFRKQDENLSGAAIAGGVGAAVGGAAVIGATLGSGVPIIGTFIGALVGAAVGIGIYALAGEEASNAEIAARNAQIDSIYGSIDAIERLGAAGKKFDDAMADLGQLPAATTEAGKRQRVQQEVDIGNELGGEIKQSNIGAEFNKLAEIAAKAGKTVGQLTDADFDKEDSEGAMDLAAFQTASQAATQGLEQLTKRTAAARRTLQKAADLEITGEFSFTEMINQGGLFAQSLKAARSAIAEETKAKVAAAQADQKAAQKRMADAEDAFAAGDEGAQEAQKQALTDLATAQDTEARARERGIAQLKAQDQAYAMQADAAVKRRNADIQAAAAAEVLRKQLLQTTNFMMALNDIEFNQQETEKALGNQAALQSGGDLDFSRTAPKGLSGDLTMIKDLNQFNQEMLAAISDYPPALQKEAKRQLAIVTQSSKVFSQGRDNVLKNFGAPVKGKFGPDQQKDIIRAAGLDPDKLDKDVLAGLMEQIVKVAQNGITAEEFDQIFGPLKEQGTAAQANLQKMNELRNNELKNYSSYLDILQSRRDEQIQAVQNFISVQQSNAELLAEARGGSVSALDKERGRTRKAQAGLSGTGVRAGDVGAASRALREAKKRRAIIAEEIKNRKASGQSIKNHMALDKKLQDVIKKTTAELERLADQSDRASDIMSQIDEEKAKREVLVNLITDFVVAGKEGRRELLAANAGVVQAIETGTLQNQNPEQRAATVDFLDRLENIALPAAGGLTGKEVKQELIFRDAIRMGLDPQIARQLATATSKEEQLIRALERLTQTMQQAAAAAGAATGGLITSSGGVAYRAGGGSIFQPKGTDTVPAMLTPGEYVIKKSAVDRVGVGTLSAINSGRYARGGLVQYRAPGGMIDDAEFQKITEQNRKKASRGMGLPMQEARPYFNDYPAGIPQWMLDNRKEAAAEAEKKRIAGQEDVKKRFDYERSGEDKYVHARNYADAPHRRWDEWAVGSKAEYEKDAGLLYRGTERAAGQNRFGGRGSAPSDLMPPELLSMQRQQKAREAEKARLAALEAERKRKEDIAADKELKVQAEERAKDKRLGGPKFGSVKEAQADLKRQRDFDRGVEARVEELAETKLGTPTTGVKDIALEYAAFKAREKNLLPSAELPNFGDDIIDWYNSVTGQGGMGGRARSPELVNSLDKLTKQLQAASNTAGTATRDAQGRAFGGLVQYRAGGGSIFQPRGTDTVPAMLTPGEFVIKKSSVDKIGRGNLAALNNGYANGGLVQYRQQGGGINAIAPNLIGGGLAENEQIRIPSGEQVKALFAQGVRSDFGYFLRQAKEAYGEEAVRNLSTLARANELDPSKLSAPEDIAGFMERIRNNYKLFRSINADGVVLNPPFVRIPGNAGDAISLTNMAKELTKIRNFYNALKAFESDADGNIADDSSIKVAGNVINNAFGYNPGNRVVALSEKITQYRASLKPQMNNIRDAIKAAQRAGKNKVFVPGFNAPGRQLLNEEDMRDIRQRGAIGARGNVPERPGRGGDRVRGREDMRAPRIQQALDALRDGGGGVPVLRFAQGGAASGTDTVPAMLTPGEFVMSRAAVAQHGVGYMKSLNRGRIPGFNRGGVVGHGGVQYKQNGGPIGRNAGVLSIDPKLLQNTLTAFHADFSLSLDRIVRPLDNMSRSLLEVARSFQRLEMFHTFKGELGLSVNISNKDAIIAAVAEGIQPNIEQLIIDTVDMKLSDQRFGQ
jgi:TP901 family phage tail tape measure protein